MSKSEDINTLFRRFGGDANSYQEIVSIDQTRAAEQQWPMLGQLKPLAHAEAPAAKRSAVVGDRMAQVEVVIYKTVPQIVHVPTEPPVPLAVPTPPVVDLPAAALRETVVPMAPVETATAPAAPLLSDAVAPVLPAPVASAGLQSVFDRLLPRVPDVAQPVATSPLKRLIKW